MYFVGGGGWLVEVKYKLFCTVQLGGLVTTLNMIGNLYCKFTKTIFFLDEYWLDCEDPENERRPEVNH